jgi:hypothetical protein
MKHCGGIVKPFPDVCEDTVKRTPDIKRTIEQRGADRCGSFSPCFTGNIAGSTVGIAGQG